MVRSRGLPALAAILPGGAEPGDAADGAVSSATGTAQDDWAPINAT